MPNYQAVARQAAAKFGIPADVFLRQIQQESGFNPNARSGAGAIGIAQFMPATARGFGIDPTNPVQSLFAAARYDRQGVDKYGSLQRALSAYNSGRPDAYLDPHFAGGQTYNYVRQILGGHSPVGAPPAGTAAAAAPPGPPGGPAAAPPSVNIGAILNQGARAVGLPQLSAKIFTAAPTATGQTVQFARVHKAPTSPHEDHVVGLAKEYLGTPYQWGGATPAGFDCSGFVHFLAAKQGVNIGRTTYQQFKQGTPVGRGQLMPGDVVFFEPSAQGPGHEALYIGNGSVIAAPHTGSVVQIQSLSGLSKALGYVGARRLI